MPTVDQYRAELRRQFLDAERFGHAFVEINAGELCDELGGDVATCCAAMLEEQGDEDEIVDGDEADASLTIRFRFPR